MVSQASSQKAMITSCALRCRLRSDDRKLVLASCWVMVLPPWRTPPALHVGDHRAADAARVDAPMAVEAAVLDRDEGGRSHRVELADVDRRFLDRAAPGDRQAFLRDEQDGGVVEGLQRSRQGRGHDQPDQCDEQDSGNRVEHQRPATTPGLLDLLVNRRPIRAAGRRARTDRAVPPGWSRPAPDPLIVDQRAFPNCRRQVTYFSKTVRRIYPEIC